MTAVRVVGVIVLCGAVVSIGCGKKVAPATTAAPPASTIEATPPAPPQRATSAAAVATADALSEEDLFARKTLDELNAEQPLADALFDLDQWTIRDDARARLQTNAAWLKRWRSTRVTIEGHSDERATSEYNLALGDRRAKAVKDYLESLGVTSDRILVVTKGEESPVCREAHEGCWQQNRRGHPVITAK